MSDDIAGLTRRVPQPVYSAVVPGMGRVTLQRDRPRHFALALDLEPAFAASLSTGRGATDITLPGPRPERFRGTVGDLRALIMEHRLLERPELLRSARTTLLDADADVRAALDALRHALAATSVRPDRFQKHRCPRCPAPPEAPPKRPAFAFYNVGIAQPVREDCAHVALFPRALDALMNAHPELTFELANLITPDAHEAPTRFVLSTDLMPPLLTAWLLPGRALARARRAYDAWSWGSSHARTRRTAPRKSVSRLAWEGVSEARRAGLTFAAKAWECDADAPRFAHRPEGAMDTAPWQPDDAPAALDLAVVLPEEFRAPPAPTRSTPTAKPATTKAAAKPATTKATAKPATTKATAKPATTKATAKPATTKAAAKPAAKPAKPANAADAAPGAKLPPPGKLFTLKDLAALGHGPADVKRLLKSGAIVRESFGWYRVATV